MAAFTPLNQSATLGPACSSTATCPASSVMTMWSSKNAAASCEIGANGLPSEANAVPYSVWA